MKVTVGATVVFIHEVEVDDKFADYIDVFNNNTDDNTKEWQDARALFQECYDLCYDATQRAIEEVDRGDLEVVAIKGWTTNQQVMFET